MEQILENDRKFGEDDYGDKKEEIQAHQYITAKFGKDPGPLVPGGYEEEKYVDVDQPQTINVLQNMKAMPAEEDNEQN